MPEPVFAHTSIKCECGNDLHITDPIIEIVNQISFCALVLNHAAMQGNVCSKCGKKYFMCIQGFNLAAIKLALLPVPEEKEVSRIITNATGFDPRKTN
jgi:hypothetical protein